MRLATTFPVIVPPLSLPREVEECHVPHRPRPARGRRGGAAARRRKVADVKAMTPDGQDGSLSKTFLHLSNKKDRTDVDTASTRASNDADSASSWGEDELTTVIFRNISNDCTRECLTELLDSEGFCGTYDFVHVPVKFQSFQGIGYGLVNMVDQPAGERLLKHFKNYCGELVVNDVAWSKPRQGFLAHVDRYRNSPVMHESVPEMYHPAIFQNGVRMQFPEPTREIRLPRIRHLKTAVTN